MLKGEVSSLWGALAGEVTAEGNIMDPVDDQCQSTLRCRWTRDETAPMLPPMAVVIIAAYLPWLALVGLALGSMYMVNLIKGVWPGISRPHKNLLSQTLIIAGGWGVLWDYPVTVTITVILGACGLASLAHQAYACLQSKKDLDRLTVRKNLPQQRPGPRGL
jgi:hypothetical protein